MEQEVACSSSNLMQHYEAIIGLVTGPGLTDADKYAFSLTRMRDIVLDCMTA